jgi:hypothetical protein
MEHYAIFLSDVVVLFRIVDFSVVTRDALLTYLYVYPGSVV